jgi:hypothetical protein
MTRIYHPYYLWEDYKAGFYKTPSKTEKDSHKQFVATMFNNEKMTYTFMNAVIEKWVISCEHNLSNPSVNKSAYLGQAACCLYKHIPNISTMYGWSFLDPSIQKRSDAIATHILSLWTQKQILKTTFPNGNKKDMPTAYQTKLLLS